MELLKKRFSSLKKDLEERTKQDRIFRELFKQTLIKIFNTDKNLKYVKNFYLKSNLVFLETKNKSFAQEVSLREAEIIKQVNQKFIFAIKRIVIK
ncbi:MAG: hypothetical protein A3I24_01025 [Candidatus Harrisonbacteria bacterium RIFCSPLOWO2_02_FULL_41_13b]|uniref:DUF721 domain-containing protein n=1 Tax=Candidatus Harrisonbacteria bacterium RIFCSPLOWO2_02_FULL_41_13b TaxID=1798409 RepID=A0A1G1ZVB8_9BACT|nr:MAG: hypothetical protein A3I24_01025 [Candidatus Harrisonbacteria bacterium RIFCSPLOWO2_02_FULL_41_13b]